MGLMNILKVYQTGFTADGIPDLTGKVAFITGGNTGLGYKTALELARRNAKVYIACRNPALAHEAAEKIKVETGTSVETVQMDLGDLKGVKKAAEEFMKKETQLHILINNAGIMACPFALTSDGIETQFGVNHVGHFVLTTTLLPLLKASAPSRIVVLSSEAHDRAPKEGILFDKINDPKVMGPWERYGQSKTANVLFARELSRRVEGSGVLVNAVHPGFVATDLTRGHNASYPILAPATKLLVCTMALPIPTGALTQLYVATSPDIEKDQISGAYFVPIATRRDEDLTPAARDGMLAAKLWKFTEVLVKEKIGSV
ncbi:Retinol dehydrogenase 14 [Borealophlyctis nickersoniae]|nr:Retinol dehydrogenase 14 [Borealophlyctis nickersoniae]